MACRAMSNPNTGVEYVAEVVSLEPKEAEVEELRTWEGLEGSGIEEGSVARKEHRGMSSPSTMEQPKNSKVCSSSVLARVIEASSDEMGDEVDEADEERRIYD
ncbi:hypothetical protein H6P81_006733 [Aristolochia fimbriata]|uniref:Uncharacterized protein n=1 Tax=Aristolochia fimbriata TaxID=158543 RepID=A0AAV7EZA5_ARIFI|nr:hypothetical protein H6P81_006733 [Aristolochia fimbriata]